MRFKQKYDYLFVRGTVLVFVFLMGFSENLLAAQVSPESELSIEITDKGPEVPKLSEIIPLAEDLSVRLAKLENAKLNLPDLAAVEKDYSQIEDRVNAASDNLGRLKTTQTADKAKVLSFQRKFVLEKARLKKINTPLEEVIDKFDTWGKEWQREQQRWESWHAALAESHSFSQIQAVFADVNTTIDSALVFTSQQLKPLLAAQSRGERLTARIEKLEAEYAALQSETRKKPLIGKSPPMYTWEYYTQFGVGLWLTAWENLQFIPWPGKEFFILHGVELGVLLLIIFAVLPAIYRKRQAFAESNNWAFVAERPVATVLFITSLVATIQMQFWSSSSELMTALMMIVGSMACLRLLVRVLKNEWAKKVSCGVMSLYAVTVVFLAVNMPAPIYSLFVFVVSLIAVVYTVKLAKELNPAQNGYFSFWGLRALYLWFAVIVLAEFLGNTGVAASMFENSILTMATMALIALFLYLLRGAIHWVFFASPLWRIKLMRSDAEKNERTLMFVLESLVGILLILPAILAIWGMFDSFPNALSGILSPGFEISGGQRITIGLVLSAILALYGSLYVSRIIPKILLDEKFVGRQMDRGVISSTGHLLRYFIIFLGLLLTLALLGFSLTNLTIILSALGVGIGFGLQGIVNNFVSGLILLFERPIREGDTLVLGNLWANVKNIGMRSTIVQTFDLADVIIPNADLINNQITNWTLSNRQARVTIPVGVDYGSDVPLVVDTLLACAKDHDSVSKQPIPEVLFVNLGESSLDFELRVWIHDTDNRLLIKSQLYHEIVRRFREQGIIIPFPQRDLHLFGDVGAVSERLRHNTGEELFPKETHST